MERLGLGPEECLSVNPRLIFGRMTGWGRRARCHRPQGMTSIISPSRAPWCHGLCGSPAGASLNLVGDFGGGAMYLLTGILAALVERATSGQGQIIDAAMTDGTASLLSPFFGLMAMNMWTTDRFSNRLDGGAFYYGSYECSDGNTSQSAHWSRSSTPCFWKKQKLPTRNFKSSLMRPPGPPSARN